MLHLKKVPKYTVCYMIYIRLHFRKGQEQPTIFTTAYKTTMVYLHQPTPSSTLNAIIVRKASHVDVMSAEHSRRLAEVDHALCSLCRHLPTSPGSDG